MLGPEGSALIEELDQVFAVETIHEAVERVKVWACHAGKTKFNLFFPYITDWLVQPKHLVSKSPIHFCVCVKILTMDGKTAEIKSGRWNRTVAMLASRAVKSKRNTEKDIKSITKFIEIAGKLSLLDESEVTKCVADLMTPKTKPLKIKISTDGYNACKVIEIISDDMKPPSEIRFAAFRLLHEFLAAHDSSDDQGDFIVAAIASLYLSGKLHSDRYKIVSLGSLVRAYGRVALIYAPLNIFNDGTASEDSVKNLKVNIFQCEARILRQINFNFSAILNSPGQDEALRQITAALKLPDAISAITREVLANKAYLFSPLCVHFSSEIITLAAIVICNRNADRFFETVQIKFPTVDLQLVRRISLALCQFKHKYLKSLDDEFISKCRQQALATKVTDENTRSSEVDEGELPETIEIDASGHVVGSQLQSSAATPTSGSVHGRVDSGPTLTCGFELGSKKSRGAIPAQESAEGSDSDASHGDDEQIEWNDSFEVSGATADVDTGVDAEQPLQKKQPMGVASIASPEPEPDHTTDNRDVTATDESGMGDREKLNGAAGISASAAAAAADVADADAAVATHRGHMGVCIPAELSVARSAPKRPEKSLGRKVIDADMIDCASRGQSADSHTGWNSSRRENADIGLLVDREERETNSASVTIAVSKRKLVAVGDGVTAQADHSSENGAKRRGRSRDRQPDKDISGLSRGVAGIVGNGYGLGRSLDGSDIDTSRAGSRPRESERQLRDSRADGKACRRPVGAFASDYAGYDGITYDQHSASNSAIRQREVESTRSRDGGGRREVRGGRIVDEYDYVGEYDDTHNVGGQLDSFRRDGPPDRFGRDGRDRAERWDYNLAPSADWVYHDQWSDLEQRRVVYGGRPIDRHDGDARYSAAGAPARVSLNGLNEDRFEQGSFRCSSRRVSEQYMSGRSMDEDRIENHYRQTASMPSSDSMFRRLR